MRMTWADEVLTITDARLRGLAIRVTYLEAFCRDGSTDRAWEETVIPHRTTMVSADASRIRLCSMLADGVVAEHIIDAGEDEISFAVQLRNPTNVPSRAHWAQPCVR